MSDLDALEARAEKATPGPYSVEGRLTVIGEPVGPFVVIGGDSAAVAEVHDDGAPGEAEANAAYIAACDPQAILALIARVREAEARVERSEAREGVLREALADYGEHTRECARAYFEAGEPTPDGGYRQLIRGVWYETKPVDRTPKCDCGLGAALASAEKGEGDA